jgi:CTP:molybdopterin cytidylyltransferase MocA
MQLKFLSGRRLTGSGRRRLGVCAALSAAALVGVAASDAAVTGFVNDPPAAPHSIISFPQRDFVSASGYALADGPVRVDVIRGGSVVSSATNITPQDDPSTSGFDGLVEVNHPGGACWENVTPDIRPGDEIRITTSTGVADQTVTANVTAQRAVQVAADTVVVHGTAQDALGNPLPLDQIQQRLISGKDAFKKNGRRLLRSDKDGTLSYDAAGSINWTATYKGLVAEDVTRALKAESRGIWLGRFPAAGTEQTIYENGDGIVAGPQAPCTAPLEGTTPAPPPAPGPVPAAPATTSLSEPPVAPHALIAFPQRDFISGSGFAATDTVTVNIIRGGVTIGSSQGLVPQDDPKTAGFDGIVEVNHPGGGCWEGATPDIRPGDQVRYTLASGAADQTTVANVTAERAIQTAADTVVVHGTAQDALGNPLPLDQIQQRLIAGKDLFSNGRRLLRSDKDGTLSYDAAGSINWTATYSGLIADDVTRALAAESRGVWLGRSPLAGTEQTIFENGDGIFGGPQFPCTAPLVP